MGVGDDVILSRLKENGIGFTSDEASLAALKEAGASEKVLSAVKAAAATTKPAGAKSLTVDEVVKLVDLKIGDDVIIKRIKENTASLNPSPEHLKQLQAAGASEQLIAAVTASRSETNVMIILDCSQRMAAKLGDGSIRMNAARNALGKVISSMPDGMPVGLVCCGQSPSGDKSVANLTRALGPMSASDRDDVILLLATAAPKGKASLAESLKTAGQQLEKAAAAGLSGGGVLLITAGLDDAGGDLAAAVKQLASMPGNPVSLHIAALGVSDDDAKQLTQLAELTKGNFANVKDSDELAKLMTPKTTSTPVATTSGRRAVRVLTPKINLPEVSSLALVKPDAGYGTLSAYRFADAPKYDQEIRVPSADPFDVWWIGKEGLPVCMIRNLAITERKIVDIQPENYLGMVVVKGEGLPAPKAIVLTLSESESGGGTARSYQVQSADAFGKVMVVPAGEYDVWIFADGSATATALEKKLKVEAGGLLEIE